jgi:hypothetical protein
VKKETDKYSTEEETLSVYINDNTIKSPKLTAESWNAYFITIKETMNKDANDGIASLI